MDFKCNKTEECSGCGRCCRFHERIEMDDEDKVRELIFLKTGVVYIHKLSEFTINLTWLEAKRLRMLAAQMGIEITIIPKRVIISNKGVEVFDYSLNHTVCPFLTDNNRCRIYEKRPLCCKEFPLVKEDPEEFKAFCSGKVILKEGYKSALKQVRETLL